MRRNFLVLCALLFAPTVANSTSVDQLRDLDPTASYGVIWAPVESEELADIASATETMNDINAFLDLEDDGFIVIGSIHRFDRNQATLVYDGGFDAEEISGPGVQASRSCFEPIAWTQSRSGNSSINFQVYRDKSHDVEYAPKCGSYPCTRTAKGWTDGWASMPAATDFFWRSNWNAFNYWTTQGTGTPWYVSLYSGNSTINYLERSCSNDYTSINLKWW